MPKKKGWNDWAYFNWKGFDTPMAVRIIVILYLSECEIIHRIDQEPDILLDSTNDIIIPYLTKEKWVILLAPQSPEVDANELTGVYFDSKMFIRKTLHNDNKIWIVPLSTLVDPSFVVYNNDNFHGNNETYYQMTKMCV